MKPSRWIGALVAVVLVVFFATFATIYLGNPAGHGPAPTGGEIRTAGADEFHFVTKRVPFDDNGGPLVRESRENGGWDFLYHNPTGHEVKLGLNRTNCRCSRVVVTAAPDAWKARRALLAAGEVAAPLAPLAGLGLAAALAQDAELERLRKESKQLASLERTGGDAHALVPGHTTGWVRLEWNNEKSGDQNLQADLWVGRPDSPRSVSLEARVRFQEPLRYQSQDVTVGEVSAADLKAAPAEASLVVWSPTRTALDLKVETDPPTTDPAAEPIVVGAPVPLTAAERARLAAEVGSDGTPVGCAYRVPVTVRERSADGRRPLDYGPFKRRVLVTAADATPEPVPFLVTGSLEGDVRLGARQDGGRISFGTFDGPQGTTFRAVTVHTPGNGVTLEVDAERTAKFLDVKLEPPSDGRREWQVKVRVRAGEAAGPFPREEDEKFRDSALYLKVPGDPPRSLRIPVSGTANN